MNLRLHIYNSTYISLASLIYIRISTNYSSTQLIISIYIIFYCFNIAPSVSLSFSSSTQLNINLTAPTGSSSLIYKCIITEIDMPPITVTGTELEYTVDDLSSDGAYTVNCTSSNSNGDESCNSNVVGIGCSK